MKKNTTHLWSLIRPRPTGQRERKLSSGDFWQWRSSCKNIRSPAQIKSVWLWEEVSKASSVPVNRRFFFYFQEKKKKNKKKQRFVQMHADVHVCKYCPVVRKDPKPRKWRRSSSMHTYRKSLGYNREVALMRWCDRLSGYFSEKSFFAQCHLT